MKVAAVTAADAADIGRVAAEGRTAAEAGAEAGVEAEAARRAERQVKVAAKVKMDQGTRIEGECAPAEARLRSHKGSIGVTRAEEIGASRRRQRRHSERTAVDCHPRGLPIESGAGFEAFQFRSQQFSTV